MEKAKNFFRYVWRNVDTGQRDRSEWFPFVQIDFHGEVRRSAPVLEVTVEYSDAIPSK